jgi:hypothetical protein
VQPVWGAAVAALAARLGGAGAAARADAALQAASRDFGWDLYCRPKVNGRLWPAAFRAPAAGIPVAKVATRLATAAEIPFANVPKGVRWEASSRVKVQRSETLPPFPQVTVRRLGWRS